ncbi:glutamate-rich protein 1 [Cyprinodon tularosa]|uniref:glutamate-rich protein 1 n=1 Tax=Cyprinodon tularosa TaxID=77115 RepID=UPI0018E27A04|nr:glutamate-rich protein 1 [Cyprinodon tularosa]
MAHRKDVFKSKVLQKLYPAVVTVGKEQNASAVTDDLPTATGGKIRTGGEHGSSGDAGKLQNAATSSRKMYTVLPPPPDYNMHLEKSVILPQIGSVNNAEDPAEGCADKGGEEEDGEKEAEDQQCRRRRKKKRPAVPQDCGKDGPPVSDESGPSPVPVNERGEQMSRNKRRKLKKKRHKEKLLSLGLMPRAAALEFTYSKDGEEDERKAAELSEFMSTTLEIYMSDSSPHMVQTPHLCATVDGLLKELAGGSKPNSVLNQLYSLKTLVQQNMAGSLEKALSELNNSPDMSAEEANAVVSLFRYWITEILPMQRDKTAGLSATQQ